MVLKITPVIGQDNLFLLGDGVESLM
jgi:hypothetical protein